MSANWEAAVAVYAAALAEATDNRLSLLSNMGLCYLKLDQVANAILPLRQAMALTPELFDCPQMATKVALRLYEAYRATNDNLGARGALADLRFFMRRDTGHRARIDSLPPAHDAKDIFQLLNTIMRSANFDHPRLNDTAWETCDEKETTAFQLATEWAARSKGRGPTSFGVRLLEMILRNGSPPNARSAHGITPLMTSARNGRADLCSLLLAAGASVKAVTRRGSTPLHEAINGLHGPDPIGGGSSTRAPPEWVQEHEDVVALLLEHDAPVNAATTGGMTPLMSCAQQLRGERSNNVGAARLLIAAGASTTSRIAPTYHVFQGYMAIDLCVKGDQAPFRELLLRAAHKEGLDAVASLTEAEKIGRYLTFFDEATILLNRTRARSTEDVTRALERTLMLSETAKPEPADAGEVIVDVSSNPLLKLYLKLELFVPRIVVKKWTNESALTDSDRGEICRVWDTQQRAHFLQKLPGPEDQTWLVPNILHQEYLLFCQGPVQQTYSFAIPTEAALEALEELELPILEIGAGTGYWGALLRARGVECVLYDREPPTARGDNPYFTTQYTKVLKGDHNAAAQYGVGSSDYALLLVWPYSEDEAKAPWARSEEPWDVKALQVFRGTYVAHVGELNELPYNVTTSKLFQQLLRDDFKQVARVDLPSWPHCNDELTIWKRVTLPAQNSDATLACVSGHLAEHSSNSSVRFTKSVT